MWPFFLRLAIVFLAIPLVPFALLGELPGVAWIDDLSASYSFCAGALLLAGDIFLPVPSSLVAVFLGARLGYELGALAIACGLTLGSLLGYGAGYYMGHPFLRRYASPQQERALESLDGQFGYFALALVRAVPVLAEASVIAAGAARFRFRPVCAVLLVSNGAIGLLYAAIGSAGHDSASPLLLFVGSMGVPALAFLFVYLIQRQLKH